MLDAEKPPAPGAALSARLPFKVDPGSTVGGGLDFEPVFPGILLPTAVRAGTRLAPGIMKSDHLQHLPAPDESRWQPRTAGRHPRCIGGRGNRLDRFGNKDIVSHRRSSFVSWLREVLQLMSQFQALINTDGYR